MLVAEYFNFWEFECESNGGVPSPFPGQFSNNNTNMFNNIKTLSEEFQIIGKTNNLNFINGGFYSHNNLLYTVNS